MKIDKFIRKLIFFGQVLKEIRFPKNRFFFRTRLPWTSQVPETGSRFFSDGKSTPGSESIFFSTGCSSPDSDSIFFSTECSRSDSGSIFFAMGHSSPDSDRIFMSDEVLEPSLGCFSYVPEDQIRWIEEVGATGGGIGWSPVSATSLLRIVYVQGTLSCFI